MVSNQGHRIRVLVISQYYYPEKFIIDDLVEKLPAYADITVLTGYPSYPSESAFELLEMSTIEHWDSCRRERIVRLTGCSRRSGSLKDIVKSWIIFVIESFMWINANRHEDWDVIFVYAPSPPTVAIGPVLAGLRGRKILWLLDMWPQAVGAKLSTMKFLSLFKFAVLLSATGLVRFLFRAYDAVYVQNEAMKSTYVSNYPKYESKIGVLNQWERNQIICRDVLSNDLCFVETERKIEEFRKNYEFVTLNCGNFGFSQNIELLLEVARECSDIGFVFIGSGNEWWRILEAGRSLRNILALDRMSQDVIMELSDKFSVGLCAVRTEGSENVTVPQRCSFYGTMGLPFIVAARGRNIFPEQVQDSIRYVEPISQAVGESIGQLRDIEIAEFQKLKSTLQQYYKNQSDSNQIRERLEVVISPKENKCE